MPAGRDRKAEMHERHRTDLLKSAADKDAGTEDQVEAAARYREVTLLRQEDELVKLGETPEVSANRALKDFPRQK